MTKSRLNERSLFALLCSLWALRNITPVTRDGADNKKCIRMLRCVREPCPHAAPHLIQTHLTKFMPHRTASYLSLKFPQTSEKKLAF